VSKPFTGHVRALRAGAATLAGTLVLIATLAAGSAAAQTGPYVALGDSYTSAPLVPNPTGNPALCLRSTHNYPQDVRAAIAPSSFTDASCSGATTVDMTQSQSLGAGKSNAPQFGALGPSDSVVTVGIGGNDAGLIGVAEECAELDVLWPFGDRCKAHYQSGGVDTEVQRIDSVQALVAAVVQGIHARAGRAKVLVVGYPDGLPQSGTNCYPIVPFSDADVSWFNSLEIDLNSVLASAAAANAATYVDTFTSSIGHDACAGSNAWVNGLLPTSAAFPLHPNAAGESNMARQVEAALS
jgi:lysophospholipase L1-like esterase